MPLRLVLTQHPDASEAASLAFLRVEPVAVLADGPTDRRYYSAYLFSGKTLIDYAVGLQELTRMLEAHDG
ncbi:MAG: hypothetical protein OXR05_00600 [Gemmatimonadota bacterium]|nr:hypothetical protein [Gemmatimonadota bacterium]